MNLEKRRKDQDAAAKLRKHPLMKLTWGDRVTSIAIFLVILIGFPLTLVATDPTFKAEFQGELIAGCFVWSASLLIFTSWLKGRLKKRTQRAK